MTPNLGAIAEYRTREAEWRGRLKEFDDVTGERDAQRRTYETLRKQRLDEFMAGFRIIGMRLKEMYQARAAPPHCLRACCHPSPPPPPPPPLPTPPHPPTLAPAPACPPRPPPHIVTQMITLGGDAELELLDSLDPFSEGIVFSVRPPKKSWKHIANLSGGEKTLASLALVFALHHYKPTPLYVMDEIDAALDFRNVSIVGNYIKERTRNAQFIIISLRNNMFERAHPRLQPPLAAASFPLPSPPTYPARTHPGPHTHSQRRGRALAPPYRCARIPCAQWPIGSWASTRPTTAPRASRSIRARSPCPWLG